MANKAARAKIMPIDIERLLYQQMKEDGVKKNLSARKYGNIIIKLYFQRKLLQEHCYPHLDKLAVRKDVIFIHDSIQAKTANVDIGKKGVLTCDLEGKTDCEHVAFAMLCNDSVEMLAKVVIENENSSE